MTSAHGSGGYDDSRLRYRISELEEQQEVQRGDLDRLVHEFGEETGEYDRVGTLERALRDAQEQLEDLDELRRDVKALTARLAWVEHRARSDSDAPVAGLEADARLRQLARTAQERHGARDGLLHEGEIIRRTAIVQRYLTALEDLDRQRAAALAASARVAATDYGTPEHQAAIQDFRAARTSYQTTQRTLPTAEADADHAAQALERDAAERERRAPRIAAAEQAWTQLQTRLRTQLGDAIGQAAILPRWFVDSFGPIPPAGGADEWMATAVDLLAYRATYSITDPVLPLGPEPADSGEHLEQQAWRARLRRALRTLPR